MGNGRARRNATGARARAIALNICKDMQREEEEKEEKKRLEMRLQQMVGWISVGFIRRDRLLRSAGCRRVVDLYVEPRLTSVGNVQEECGVTCKR